jgi:hypothetical protein
MPAIILGLRTGDQKLLDAQAKALGRPARELAGIYLEQAIRQAEAERRSRPVIVVSAS